MPYKTILVHAESGQGAAERLRLACRLARRFDAHLIGSAPTGISRFLPPQVVAEGGAALLACCEAMRRDAAAGLALFSRVVREEGVASFEERLVEDDVDGGMALQARYCDLVVVGQSSPDTRPRGTLGDVPEHLLLHGGRPLLVLPAGGWRDELQGPALLAWDGSPEATRALTGALPLLRAASSVTVMTCGSGDAAAGDAADACGRMMGYLRRQGVTVHPHRAPDTQHVGATILAGAEHIGATLLVMGGAGQSRLRELLLGSTTATVLRSMSLPVLLAH
ncbi:universal stress protein [Massilia sp. 9I]|uniref:universal stress protein n=1 Tax=Massilia sp. 9I TaxID=2653152 RepID=UPI0012F2FD6B|nr:universal stress protein [Massilia sp. 9I]VXB98616.1 Universal stress protein UspA and related nucleotide-binding proteins [Massilia sp. 9I]